MRRIGRRLLRQWLLVNVRAAVAATSGDGQVINYFAVAGIRLSNTLRRLLFLARGNRAGKLNRVVRHVRVDVGICQRALILESLLNLRLQTRSIRLRP